jgi:transcriptional regulator with XRE-family HTH domain
MANISRQYSSKDLGLRLLKLLNEQNLTQTAFANQMGFSRSYITRVKKGEAEFSIEGMDRACKILGTTPNYLMYGLEPPKYDSYP